MTAGKSPQPTDPKKRVAVATVLAAARFLLTEARDFWILIHHLQW